MKENKQDTLNNNLFKILSQDINVPESFTNSILEIKYNDKDKHTKKALNLIKIAAIFLILAIPINIGVYAYQYIENYKSKTAIGYVNSSFQESVQNGYIQNVDMNYIYSNDLGVKIEYIVMDDYNLNILFNFDTKNKSNISKEANIEDLIIYDENNNIIFCYNLKKYKDFCKKNNIKNKKNTIEQFTNGYGIQLIEMSLENNKTLYTLRSTEGFPNSKKLYIKFNEINFNQNTKIKGNWNMELNLEEQFYHRNGINYDLATKNDDINIITARATNTLMRITYEINNVNINNYSHISMYIEDQLGNQYNVNTIEDSISIYNGQISATFPINMQNAPKTMTLHISLDNEKHYSIILSQVKNDSL